ncbi:FAD-dependent oxidoreductase [Candidatus Woesearchaeota archaeon]|nr:FAD-dependent oxidoreductase [Candidatus Woesearchaeota archaeon]
MTFIRKKKIGNNYYYYLVKSIRTGKNSWKKYEKYIGKKLPEKKPSFDKSQYDVIIVGAGPAGLFSAYELANKGLKLLLIDKGPAAGQRKGEIMTGIGGAGLYSDGKLNLTPVHGKTNLYEFLNEKQANELISYVDSIFINFGAPRTAYTKNLKRVEELRKKARKNKITLLLAPQKHIGSDKLPLLIQKFSNCLRKQNINILTNTEVKDVIVRNNKVRGVLAGNKAITSRYVIACPGRSGSSWFLEQARKLDIPLKHRGIEIGVRVEIRAKLMEHITKYLWDPAFFMKARHSHDIVRTFCTCPYGFVAEETYHGFIGVNGYSNINRKSANTNFALLSNIELTEPAENTIAYGEDIGRLATTIAGGRPFIQSLEDLKRHRRSYWHRIDKTKISPTLTNTTPGDLSMAIPHRIVINLLDAIRRLDKIIPGLYENALLYGPELKFFSVRIESDKSLETRAKNLFIAGDGVGICGNIVGAAATGILAARGVLDKINKQKPVKS